MFRRDRSKKGSAPLFGRQEASRGVRSIPLDDIHCSLEREALPSRATTHPLPLTFSSICSLDVATGLQCYRSNNVVDLRYVDRSNSIPFISYIDDWRFPFTDRLNCHFHLLASYYLLRSRYSKAWVKHRQQVAQNQQTAEQGQRQPQSCDEHRFHVYAISCGDCGTRRLPFITFKRLMNRLIRIAWRFPQRSDLTAS